MREVASEELEDASSGIWVEVGGGLEGAPEDGAPDGGVSEALKAVLEERLEGVREGEREGESDCWRDRSSGSESTGAPAVAEGLGG